MQEIELTKVSVVIPCYNAGLYIEQTIKSILIQKGVVLEVIVIDDGSTDNSKEIILSINDSRIQYVFQNNKGVSSARNKGLSIANGEYLIFIDADDVIEPDYFIERCSILQHNHEIHFVSGRIKKFEGEKIYNEVYSGISNEGIKEILFYYKDIITCPSNYLLRTAFLVNHNICFNERLSSTADRFFLIECISNGKTLSIESKSKLLYRLHENSMSAKLTKKLVFDNEQFYRELIKCNLIPKGIKRQSLQKGNYILAVSFLKINLLLKSFYYSTKLIF